MGKDIFEQFANRQKETTTKTKEVTVRFRGCGHKNKPLSGPTSDVKRYIYENGVCVGTEIIKVRRRKR